MEFRLKSFNLEVQLVGGHFVVADVASVGKVDLLILIQYQGRPVKVKWLSQHDVRLIEHYFCIRVDFIFWIFLHLDDVVKYFCLWHTFNLHVQVVTFVSSNLIKSNRFN